MCISHNELIGKLIEIQYEGVITWKCVLSITYHFCDTKGVVTNDMIKAYSKPIVAQKGLIRDKYYVQDTSV
jgi:hypothetical protein